MLVIKTKEQEQFTDQAWDNYVAHALNGTIFHQKKFLGYHGESKFDNISLLFKKRDKIVALATFASYDDKGKTILHSHPGASWGGFVFSKPLSYQSAEEICILTIEYAKKNSYDEIRMTIPPAIYQDCYNDNLAFTLNTNGFQHSKRELTSVVDLRCNRISLDRSVRKNVNTAISNGLRITNGDDDLDLFHSLLHENLSEKGTEPTHSLTELTLLKKLYPQQIEFRSAYTDDEYAGGMCNWKVKKDTWLVFYCCYKKKYVPMRVLNLLFYDTLTRYRNKEAAFIDFGTSSINMKVNEGLMKFKENHGAYSVFRDTLIKNLNT